MKRLKQSLSTLGKGILPISREISYTAKTGILKDLSLRSSTVKKLVDDVEDLEQKNFGNKETIVVTEDDETGNTKFSFSLYHPLNEQKKRILISSSLFDNYNPSDVGPGYAHELKHAHQFLLGKKMNTKESSIYQLEWEAFAIQHEVAKELGGDIRRFKRMSLPELIAYVQIYRNIKDAELANKWAMANVPILYGRLWLSSKTSEWMNK